MKHLLRFGALIFPALSWATTIPDVVRRSCATQQSQGDVRVTPISWEQTTEQQHYVGNYTARYTQIRNREIGYALKGVFGDTTKKALASMAIVYDKRVYPEADASLVNVTRFTYRTMNSGGELDLNQAADWSMLTTKKRVQYLCVAFNKSMQKAKPFIYLLSVNTMPRQLYFSVEESEE